MIHMVRWVVIANVCAGLDDGEQNSNDPVTVHGSFLSFLHLRHLRIRDLQRTVSCCSAPPAANWLSCNFCLSPLLVVWLSAVVCFVIMLMIWLCCRSFSFAFVHQILCLVFFLSFFSFWVFILLLTFFIKMRQQFCFLQKDSYSFDVTLDILLC